MISQSLLHALKSCPYRVLSIYRPSVFGRCFKGDNYKYIVCPPNQREGVKHYVFKVDNL